MDVDDARELDREDLFYFPAFPATPHPIVGQDMLQRTVIQHVPPMGGMSLLDYFAAAALSGILANQSTTEALKVLQGKGYKPNEFIAGLVWQLAKATLNARPATPKPPKSSPIAKP